MNTISRGHMQWINQVPLPKAIRFSTMTPHANISREAYLVFSSGGNYLSCEKSQVLHFLFTLSGAWLTDICSQASHDKPLSITGATTRCCRRGYRRCLCWRDVEASPSHIAKETLQIEINESKTEAAVTPKDKVNAWKLTHLTISYLRASKWTVTTYPWNSVAWLHTFFYLFLTN